VNGIDFLIYVLDNFQDDTEVLALALTALSLVVEGTSDQDLPLLGFSLSFHSLFKANFFFFIVFLSLLIVEVGDGKKFAVRMAQLTRMALHQNDPAVVDAAITLWADLAYHSNTHTHTPSLPLFIVEFIE
jgi:hypothetical protein